jgi:hypothetical protein
MITLIYIAIAIAFLALILGLLRKTQQHDPDDVLIEKSYAPTIGNRRWLDLSQRIFDPSDARWLQEELAFPKLAKALTLGRKQLAIRWLEALQASFDDLIRTPEFMPSEVPETSSAAAWQMLWLTIRFKLLISYALVVVKLFGPYYPRLIPSFGWVPLSRENGTSFRRPALANSRNSS